MPLPFTHLSIIYAIETSGSLEEVKSLVKAGAPVTDAVLMKAVYADRIDLVEFALSHGTNPGAMGGAIIMHSVMHMNDTRLRILQLLLTHLADKSILQDTTFMEVASAGNSWTKVHELLAKHGLHKAVVSRDVRDADLNIRLFFHCKINSISCKKCNTKIGLQSC